MLRCRSLLMKNFLSQRSSYMLKRYLQEAAESNIVHHHETCFGSHLKKEPQRKPFLKNLLCKEFDVAVLDFPVTQSSERYKDFSRWLEVIENYVSSCADTNKILDKTEVLANLRDLELFRALVNEEYFGLNVSETELLKLTETLSMLPWLGTYFIKNYVVPVKIISKYSSDSQKQKYFPQIMKGDITSAVCIKEGESGGTNINNIESNVVPHEGDTLLLNGTKSYVVNGIDSNLFIVFARDLSKGILDKKSYSALLVERDFGGVTCSKVHNTIGRHEIPICTVNFKNTVVPRRNVIGEPAGAFDIMMEQLKPGRQNITGQAIFILRNFINRLITDVIETTHFDRNLHEFEFVQRILGDMIYSLYSMESMAYLTSGLADLYENQDVEFETIITEKYCANTCLNCIQSGLQLIGTQSYLNGNSYIQAFHDALALTTLDTNNIDANVYIASASMQYMGTITKDVIFKRRNYHMYPVYNMLQEWVPWLKKDYEIPQHLHPSLSYSGHYLQECIHKLNESIITLLVTHGTKIVEQQIELARITDMLTQIYVTTANLSRASRSYCIGLRNTHTELEMVGLTGYPAKLRFLALAEDTTSSDLQNGDYACKTSTKIAYEGKQYPMEHPLNRTQ